jgi:protease I
VFVVRSVAIAAVLVCLAVVLLSAACGKKATTGAAEPSTPVASQGEPPPPAAAQPEVNLKGKKVAMVLAPRDFRDVEFETPYEALTRAGARVAVISVRKGECVGADGVKVQAVATPRDVKPADYDGVVFVGGPGMVAYLEDASFIALAKQFASAGKLVAAICVAPAILAHAGLLDGKSATAFPDVLPTLKAKGAQVVDENVAVAGRIITGNGPQSAAAFARAVVAALSPSAGAQPTSAPAAH